MNPAYSDMLQESEMINKGLTALISWSLESEVVNPPPTNRTPLFFLLILPLLYYGSNAVCFYCDLFLPSYFSLLCLWYRQCGKLREAFQGCRKLWSSHCAPSQETWNIKPTELICSAHFGTSCVVRMHSVMRKCKAAKIQTSTQLPGDPLSTLWTIWMFELENIAWH